jgi:hypothetical protein
MTARAGRFLPARRSLLAGLLLAGAITSAPAAPQTFTGSIIDDACAQTGHAAMRMGPTDAECTKLCVMVHGGAYVLLAEGEVYKLSDQTLPEQFAGETVVVTGTLDAETKTIRVESMKRKAG